MATDERMRSVFSFRAATALVDEYLSSIQVDEETPAFLFDWQLDSLAAFVAAANALNAADAPQWMRTRLPHITTWSFVDEFVGGFHTRKDSVAGGRFGNVVLAPNTVSQFAGVVWILSSLECDPFLQAAAQAAFPGVDSPERFLAVTYNTIDTRVQRYVPNAMRAPFLRDGHPLRQLFL